MTRTRFVVRLAADGWPGRDLAPMLGDGFLVTGSEDIVADVLLLNNVPAEAVRDLRRRHATVGIVVHSSPARVIDMLTAGADHAVTTTPLAEVAARIRATARHLVAPPNTPGN